MNAIGRVLSGAPIALEFLTPLRLRAVQRHDDRVFAEAVGWYPAVGLLIGCGLLALDRGLSELLPPAPTAALLIAALALVSGGLHLDGVADTADGLAVQGDRERRLAVMRDSTTGPAGVMALVLVLLVGWSALAALEDPFRSGALVLAPALGRWAVIPVAATFTPARAGGLGQTIHRGIWPFAGPFGTLTVSAAAVALFGLGGLVLVLIAGVAALIVAAAAARLLRGVSGDIFGACIEVAQVVSWLAILAAAQRDWIDAALLG
ncbi:MAG: adenosylcobinamide-GDP ribazoletransferase [Chloroflexi bacterium]|nr:adenosylcobinamide-GDP ribazoletransferase [Chloroflexota bacterium]MDA1145525.1 adenosylcobinamide-GDP ribazoletransferase [Chloroflexota bacterium]